MEMFSSVIDGKQQQVSTLPLNSISLNDTEHEPVVLGLSKSQPPIKPATDAKTTLKEPDVDVNVREWDTEDICTWLTSTTLHYAMVRGEEDCKTFLQRIGITGQVDQLRITRYLDILLCAEEEKCKEDGNTCGNKNNNSNSLPLSRVIRDMKETKVGSIILVGNQQYTVLEVLSEYPHIFFAHHREEHSVVVKFYNDNHHSNGALLERSILQILHDPVPCDSVIQLLGSDQHCNVFEACYGSLVGSCNYEPDLSTQPLPMALVADIAISLLTGLAYIHKNCGMVHGDVRRDNIVQQYAHELGGEEEEEEDVSESDDQSDVVSDDDHTPITPTTAATTTTTTTTTTTKMKTTATAATTMTNPIPATATVTPTRVTYKWINFEQAAHIGEEVALKMVDVMSVTPEQAQCLILGEHYVADEAADVFNFGIMLIELLTGETLFADDAHMSQEDVLHAKVALLPGFIWKRCPQLKAVLSPQWVSLLDALLAPDPVQRSTVPEALECLIQNLSSSAKPLLHDVVVTDDDSEWNLQYTFLQQTLPQPEGKQQDQHQHQQQQYLHALREPGFEAKWLVSSFEQLQHTEEAMLAIDFQSTLLVLQDRMERGLVVEGWKTWEFEQEYLQVRLDLCSLYADSVYPIIRSSNPRIRSQCQLGDQDRDTPCLMFGYFGALDRAQADVILQQGFRGCESSNQIYAGRGLYFTSDPAQAAIWTAEAAGKPVQEVVVIGAWLLVGCVYPLTKQADYDKKQKGYYQQGKLLFHPYDTYLTSTHVILSTATQALPVCSLTLCPATSSK